MVCAAPSQLKDDFVVDMQMIDYRDSARVSYEGFPFDFGPLIKHSTTQEAITALIVRYPLNLASTSPTDSVLASYINVTGWCGASWTQVRRCSLPCATRAPPCGCSAPAAAAPAVARLEGSPLALHFEPPCCGRCAGGALCCSELDRLRQPKRDCALPSLVQAKVTAEQALRAAQPMLLRYAQQGRLKLPSIAAAPALQTDAGMAAGGAPKSGGGGGGVPVWAAVLAALLAAGALRLHAPCAASRARSAPPGSGCFKHMHTQKRTPRISRAPRGPAARAQPRRIALRCIMPSEGAAACLLLARSRGARRKH
jgi:hypothetical protein